MSLNRYPGCEWWLQVRRGVIKPSEVPKLVESIVEELLGGALRADWGKEEFASVKEQYEKLLGLVDKDGSLREVVLGRETKEEMEEEEEEAVAAEESVTNQEGEESGSVAPLSGEGEADMVVAKDEPASEMVVEGEEDKTNSETKDDNPPEEGEEDQSEGS